MSGQAPPRVCPLCGEEYLATVERCAECDVALVAADELAPTPELELPAVDGLVRLRVENPVWIRNLAARLEEEGIPSRVELVGETPAARRQGAPCALFVRPEDAERARRIDEQLLRRQLPDLPEDADTDWREADGCPACGAPVAPDAAECPDCGLGFVEPD